MKRSLMVSISLVVLVGVAGAAIDDVIVWNGIRSVAQLEYTLQNGYSDTTGMKLWMDFSDPAELGKDVLGVHSGILYGNATSLATDTPTATFAEGGLAASGFTSNDSRIVVNLLDPQPTSYYDRTYEMWIRNPQLSGNPNAVFFSLLGRELGGGDFDIKRMWVNADGSISMADRGYGIGISTYTSDSLNWEENAWYQISVIHDYSGVPGGDNHAIRVYRGQYGDSQVELLFDYQSTRFQSGHWLAVGGHPQGYYGQNVGRGGYLGEDTYIPEPATMALLALGTVLLRRRSA